MTMGVLWEFFEFGADRLLLLDMQKDTVLSQISTVDLDPTLSNTPVVISGIEDVVLQLSDGSTYALGLGGYLDIGIYDTMADLFVNFVGAVVFSTIGYFYIKQRGKGRLARAFIPTITEDVSRDAPSPQDTPEDAPGCPRKNAEKEYPRLRGYSFFTFQNRLT